MFKKKLEYYINNWQEKGIITEHQKNLIREDIEKETPNNNFFKIVAVIGSLFIGLGIILLISSNWEYLPKFIKLILILLMPIISLSIGYYLSYIKKDYKKIGNSFIFLGALLIGASLALFGQLYNFGGTITKLLTWWFLLTIPITFLFKFRTLAVLTISLFYLSIINLILSHSVPFFYDGKIIISLFILLSSIITIFSFIIRKNINKIYSNVLKMFEIVSIKILLLTLFISTLSKSFYLFGRTFSSGFFQNILFLVVLFFIMWFSNKKYNIILRNSTFFWLGAFMINKYFSWFWSYIQIGVFFVLLGIFLILLVFGYIKGTKYLENLKEETNKKNLKDNNENEIK